MIAESESLINLNHAGFPFWVLYSSLLLISAFSMINRNSFYN